MRRREVLLGAAALLPASRATADSTTLARGLWRDEAGFFGVGAFPEFGKGLFGFDYAEERMGPLSSSTARRWEMAGALDGGNGSAETILAEGRDLRVGTRRLSPAPIKRRPATVHSGDTSISAELAVLRGVRPRAAVLMIYGSGPAPKEAFDPWALWFLGEGFAVITYDKRGSGRSSGDWRLTSLEDLAGDAAAVVHHFRARGLSGPVFAWGASQAGWIEPQLGAAGVVDAIVMHAGSALGPAEQILAQVDRELKGYGFGPEETARAHAYYSLDVEVSRGRRQWAEIDAAYKAATAAGAEWILAPPVAAQAPERTMIRLMAEFDPAPYWRANRAPTLALFGDKDWIVPADANLPRLKAMTSPRTDLTTRVIEKANHLMFLARTGNRDEYGKLSRLAPEYFPTIRTWLDGRAAYPDRPARRALATQAQEGSDLI